MCSLILFIYSGHSSFIDHITVSTLLRQSLAGSTIIDSGANYSDDRPISCTLELQIGQCTADELIVTPENGKVMYSWRWVSDLLSY
jgi:hypothetical protein